MAQDSGRDAEFTAFVAGASATLGRTAWLLTGDRDAAAELLQATLVKTYVAWPRVRPDGAAAYARRVMVNLDIDAHRARHGTVAMAEPPERATADRSAAVDERERLGRVLATLPGRQRRVVVLRYLHDLSEHDVAVELGLPLGTVKSSAARGLAALRAALGQEEESHR
ncbi:MAG: SigE family RNA polymerase sigma factor [Actinobacteria bacterium]|nr:SigE family RNA polymerase sigma factor [Actinomycetota bacterium]